MASQVMQRYSAIGWRLFLRELGRGELTIIALALVLAVSSVMALSSVTDRVQQAIMAKSAAFLAADRDIYSAYPIDTDYVEQAQFRGIATDRHIYFTSMAFSHDAMNIAVVKAVTESYPLRGELQIDRLNGTVETVTGPKQGEAWISLRLFHALKLDEQRLQQQNYQSIEIGEAKFSVTAIIKTEPDAPFEIFNSGTRVIIHYDDVAKTEVIQPGSRVSYRDLFAGDADELNEFETWLTPLLKDNQKFRDVKQGASNMTNALTRAERFLMLAGVLGVLLAATAVAVSAKLFSQRHLDAIAIFKTLGASQSQVKLVYLSQLAMLTLVSIVIGIVIGFALQSIAVNVMASYLPDELPDIGFRPMIMAVVTGVLCAFMFSTPALLKLFSVPPLRVLRRTLGDDFSVSWLARLSMVATTLLLVFIYSQDIKLTLIVAAVGAGLVVIMLLLSLVFLNLSRKVSAHVGRGAWKIALASLKRRASSNVSQLIGFIMAIMLILVLYALENSIIKEWQQQLPKDAPNHFVINISGQQLPDVKAQFSKQGIEPELYYPLIRGRLVQINDDKVVDSRDDEGGKLTSGEKENENQEQSQGRQGFGRELNLTFLSELPNNNEIVQGEWLPEGVTAQVSVEQRSAERLDIKLGDKLGFLIGAQQVTVTVTSIRTVDWNSLQPNFYMILSADVLADFPATFITSFHLPKEQKLWVNSLLSQFPTLSVIDVEAMISETQNVIEQVSVSIRYVLLVVVLAATLVLIAQIMSSLDERKRETVIFRTLGANGSVIKQAISYEFFALGGIAGFIAAILAEWAVFLLQWQMFNMSWQWHPVLWLIGPLSGAVFVALVGRLSTRSLLALTPTQLIRQLN